MGSEMCIRDSFEAWFLSDAHDDEAFEVFRAALPKAAQAASQVISA